jgi:hypothetical protein
MTKQESSNLLEEFPTRDFKTPRFFLPMSPLDQLFLLSGFFQTQNLWQENTV